MSTSSSSQVVTTPVEGKLHKEKKPKRSMPDPRNIDIKQVVPILDWLPKYNVKEYLLGDLVSGLTVGVMLIPQGMAYSLLAGLPPQYGLYSSVLPILIYALFGTSRQLAVGPVATVSLLVAEALHTVHDLAGSAYEGLDEQGQADFNVQIAITLSLLVGVINIAFSILQLGVVADLLSHSVLIGFTSGAAVVIGLSQLKHIMGFSIEATSYPIYKLIVALRDIANTNVAAFVTGLLAIVLLLILRKTKRIILAQEKKDKATGMGRSQAFSIARSFVKFITNINALVVVLIATAVTGAYKGEFEAGNPVSVVGVVPANFPPPMVPNAENMAKFLPTLVVPALVITILGFMESYAVAESYGKANGYLVIPNQELFALGAANLIGAFFNAYPVTGGFSRTAVNADAGARTTIASIVSVAVVLFALYVLTESLEYLPKSVLASIILVAVSGLFKFSAMKLAWKVSKYDFTVMMITFLIVVVFGVEIGLLVGFASSLIAVLQVIASPHNAVLGVVKSPDTDELMFRNIKRYDDAERNPKFAILRVDAPIWFANSKQIKMLIASTLKEHFEYFSQNNDQMTEEQAKPKAFILDASAIGGIDLTGLEAMYDEQKELNGQGIRFIVANARGPVRDKVMEFNSAHHGEPLIPWYQCGVESMNCMTRTVQEAVKIIQDDVVGDCVVSSV